jgi:hypothetical protein
VLRLATKRREIPMRKRRREIPMRGNDEMMFGE